VGAVIVCVLTYRRNRELGELLPALIEQAALAGPEASVLVVDNDPDGGAAEVVSSFPAVRYVHEQEPGIAAARNRALAEASSARYLVFIDDDETPTPDWLGLLLETVRTTQAAAVVGSVESVFEVEPSAWVRAGEFFARRRLTTGTRVREGATNNLILDLEVVRRLGLRFDGEFGLSGGSDTLFTLQLTSSGEELVWCDEALVYDRVPAARTTREWVLRRAFRAGNTLVRCALVLSTTAWSRAAIRVRFGLDGAARTVLGYTQFLIGQLSGRTTLSARGRRRAARGSGMVAGVIGHVHVEYKRETAA